MAAFGELDSGPFGPEVVERINQHFGVQRPAPRTSTNLLADIPLAHGRMPPPPAAPGEGWTSHEVAQRGAGAGHHNFGWKLLSLGIAVVIWAVVASEPELSTFATAPVEYKNLPETWRSAPSR